MPGMSTVHFDVALTNMLQAWSQNELVADQVMPSVPVDKYTDKYFILTKDAFISTSGLNSDGRPAGVRAPGGLATEIDFTYSNQAYATEEFAKRMQVPCRLAENADLPLDVATDAALVVGQHVANDMENYIATKAMKRANYDTGNKVQLANGSTSWYAATGKPISVDIVNATNAVMSGLFRKPNILLGNMQTLNVLSQNAEYIDRFKYTSHETATTSGTLPVIGGMKILEANAFKKTSADGATPVTGGYMWVDDQGQNSALIYYKPPIVPGMRTISYGLTFDAPDELLGARGLVVNRGTSVDRKVFWLQAQRTLDARFTATDGSTNGDNSSGYAQGAYLVSGATL